MDFVHYPLNYLSGGEVVVVTINMQANVILLDNTNFANYRSRQRFTYFGGLQKKSPCRIKVPHAGTWHVVIDIGGATGQLNHSLQILK